MKYFFALSLLLNVALLGVMSARKQHSQPIPRTPRSEVGQTASHGLRKSAKGNSTPANPSTPWQEIDSANIGRLVANLRALGCPERTIQDIVVLRVCRQFRDRVMQLEKISEQQWDYSRERQNSREKDRQRSALRQEMISTIESALDKSWTAITANMLGWPDLEDHRLDFLTTEKRKLLRELDQRYDGLMEELDEKRRGGKILPAERARLEELYRQKQAEMAGILPANEYEEYNYRNSQAAYYVRQYLPPATSEEEFRKMVRVADELGVGSWRNPPDPSESDENESVHDARALMAALQQRLQEVLGDDVIARQEAEKQIRAEEEAQRQKEQSMEEEGVRIAGYAEEAGVPVADAQKFFERLKQSEAEFRPKFEEYEKSLTGTSEEKKEAMKAVVLPVLEKMAIETMGEKGRLLVEKMIQHDL